MVPIGRDEDGHLELFDFGYVDLYSIWRLLPNALLNGDPLDEDLANVGKEFLEPFFGYDIAAKALGEVVFNRKETGGQVWNPEQDDEGEQVLKILNHLRKAFSPSTLLQGEKIWKAHEEVRTLLN